MSKPLIRKSFPKVRVVIVKGQTLYQVDARKQGTSGKRESFASVEKALNRAREIADDVEQHGYGAMLPLQLRAMALRCSERLAEFGKSLEDATTHYIGHLENERARLNSATVATLADEWFADKKSGAKKTLRQDTLDDIEETARLLKTLFPEKRILQVTQDDIENYLDGLTVSLRRKYNRKNLMGQFFNWCRGKHKTTYNPCEGIEIVVPSTTPRILNVEECAELMRLCETPIHADLRGYVAICLFAGLRPTECQLLNWEQVHLEERQITVLDTTSKIKETRTVTIEPTLNAWLQPIARASGFVTSPTNFRPRFERLKIAAGYKVNGSNPNGKEWIEDGLRHCYASYWLAKHNDRAHLAEAMGTSLKMIKRHYKAIVARSKTEAFWGLLPTESVKEERRELAAIRASF